MLTNAVSRRTEQPPARFYWTKELDLRIVRAIQVQLGETDVIKHQRKEGTAVNWEAILAKLQQSPEGWPSSINSTIELRKRWDNNFRVWYAKAMPADADEGGQLRASTVSLSRLLTLLSNRDYVQDSKPGPKRGAKMVKRRRSKSDDDTSPGASIQSLVIVKKNKIHEPALVTEARLESWLSLLRDPQFQKDFLIHTHSDIILEPKVLFDLYMGRHVAWTNTLMLARSIASPEWAARLCETADVKSVQVLLTLQKCFFMLPSNEVMIDKRLLLFSVVLFENQMPQWYNFVQALEGESDEKLLAAKPLDLALSFSDINIQWWNKLTSLSTGGVLGPVF